MAAPTDANPLIAAAVMHDHLDRFWTTSRPGRLGWLRWRWDELHTVVRMIARRADGTEDPYLVKLGAKYYDAFPPTVLIVRPDGTRARTGSRWFPAIANCPWFGLHDTYEYPDKTVGQLVCMSVTAEYYLSNHTPEAQMVWTQGRHTVAATLNRLDELMRPPYYQGPSGAGE